jgi:hypothetical protein
MSTDTPWIEQYIKENQINHYEYNEFNNLKEINNELFGKVFRANWKREIKSIALKSFDFGLNNATIKEIICEVRKSNVFLLVLNLCAQ